MPRHGFRIKESKGITYVLGWISKIQREVTQDLGTGGRFARLPNPLKSLPLHLIQFEKSHEGLGPVFGLGVAPTLKKAQIVAYFEYIERLAYLQLGAEVGLTSSNGIAAHKFRFLAKRSGAFELFERDAFLAHWYSQSPFRHWENAEIPPVLKLVIRELKVRGQRTILATTSLGFQPTVVCFLINEATGGFCIGTSAGKGKTGDAFKALIEAVINLEFGDYGIPRADLIAEARGQTFESLNSHRAYWLYVDQLPKWVNISASHRPLERHPPRINFLLLKTHPFPVVAAQSESLLQLEAGPPSNGSIDKLTARLSSRYTSQSPLPHPMF
ncbi:MAG: YcaO-like family protein [Bdellovibrionales bacterium]